MGLWPGQAAGAFVVRWDIDGHEARDKPRCLGSSAAAHEGYRRQAGDYDRGDSGDYGDPLVGVWQCLLAVDEFLLLGDQGFLG
ncbi:hypothetical protein [Candidatus Poriferisocius sp.]|uniref:hypothetical protein n=1 Tax=Candidatus Poriferisocius sp. TaxID=3101276 RepID=UPI003B02B4B2